MAIWGDDAMGSQGLTVLPQSSYNEREKACSVNSRQDAMMSVWIDVSWEQGLDAGVWRADQSSSTSQQLGGDLIR